MKILDTINSSIKKFAKGMFALFTINILIFGGILLVQSCQTEDFQEQLDANANFLSVLEQNKMDLNQANLILPKFKKKNLFRKGIDSDNEIVSLSFPDNFSENEIDEINNNTESFTDLMGAIQKYDAVMTYDNSESEIVYDIPVEEVTNMLQPTLIEAKKYLYTKGFNDLEIQNMILEEEGQELDLIPFVMALTSIEKNQKQANNIKSPNLFANTAYAKVNYKDYIRCAIIGIGADAIWALGGSSSSSWGKAAMKRAFGAVAKRLLGPIGVAIAVGTFGICIAEAYLTD
ncbi:hypothetical protein SAMN05216503_3361 [Polaribacter sp. KT25b]|uniref:hypothetical protein n=1 Tax=Polaribacter sp. KT25b TaxID=1855336 RepID=UPI00087C8ADD|nr:hypothetical protein [Polaribacter sp. KT25b]SDS53166.1 hypothetical protein SAMN05216503_3361 [Polaribacter sp. KT25b]